jgi:hypothetical protein
LPFYSFIIAFRSTPEAVKKANFAVLGFYAQLILHCAGAVELLKIMYLCHTPPFYFWEGRGAGVVKS